MARSLNVTMPSRRAPTFDVRAFLESAGIQKKSLEFRRTEGIFSQGDMCNTIMYIQTGGVKLTARSKIGREVVIATLGPGDFFGEGCIAGQRRRIGTATAVTSSTIVVFKKKEMLWLLHTLPALAHRFIAHMLGANNRIEEDLIDQVFGHDEKRLARTLLRLARYGREEVPEPVLPRLSRTKLAKMAGTSTSRVDFFLRKFRRLGFIDAGRPLTINSSLLSVVLHD
jgi:CRP/FNR family cyclic AMP-dependent transcriptional regulator